MDHLADHATQRYIKEPSCYFRYARCVFEVAYGLCVVCEKLVHNLDNCGAYNTKSVSPADQVVELHFFELFLGQP